MLQTEERNSRNYFDQQYHNNHHTLTKGKQLDVVSHPPWCHWRHQIRNPENTLLLMKKQSETR